MRSCGVLILVALLSLFPASSALARYHSADTDRNNQFSLPELLRVIQFFNAGGLHCEAGTEDGYAPGPGDESCAPYDSDYAPQDWVIGLSELLRMVQLYNFGYYRDCSGSTPASEDGFCAADGQVYSFADPNLEAAVREALAKPTGDLMANEILSLTTLDASSRNILRLEGLEYCANLVTLNLSGNPIGTLSTLGILPSLTALDLSNTDLSDVSRLQDFPGLMRLNLANNQISNFAGLGALAHLEALDLSGNQIQDLAGLPAWSALRTLSLANNQLGSVEALAALSTLEVLDVSSNPLLSLTGLDALASLRSLDVSHTQAGNLDLLAVLENLETLRAADAGLASLPGFSSTVLASLDLSANQLSDLAPLSALNALTALNVEDNLLSTLAPLSGLTALTSLYAGGNQLTDTTALIPLANLNSLGLQENVLSRIHPLLDNTGLRAGDTLNLLGNPLGGQACRDVATLIRRGVSVTYDPCAAEGEGEGEGENQEIPVYFPDAALETAVRSTLRIYSGDILRNDMRQLIALTAQDRGIVNLEGLQYATRLQELALPNNLLSDLAPLEGLSALYYLQLSGNQISDLSFLSSLPGLTELYLDGNAITDITPLASCTLLHKLDLSNNHLDSLSPLSGLDDLNWVVLVNDQLTEIAPLLQTPGLAQSGMVALYENPLSTQGCADAATLAARGIYVGYSPCGGEGEGEGEGEAGVVLFPDPGLEQAVRNALIKPYGPLYATELLTLTNLVAVSWNITNLEGLQYCANLLELRLDENLLQDLSPLAALSHLQSLSLRWNPLSDIGSLSGLSTLNTLVLSQNSLSDLSPIAGLTQLSVLMLDNNLIADIGPLAGLGQLTTLALTDNAVQDIGPPGRPVPSRQARPGRQSGRGPLASGRPDQHAYSGGATQSDQRYQPAHEPRQDLLALSRRQPHQRPESPAGSRRPDATGPAEQPHHRNCTLGGELRTALWRQYQPPRESAERHGMRAGTHAHPARGHRSAMTRARPGPTPTSLLFPIPILKPPCARPLPNPRAISCVRTWTG